MPVVNTSSYQAPRLFRSPHLQTLYPHLLRKNAQISYQRERMLTPDNDFIDLDWSTVQSKRLVIISHGLEGSARSGYVRNFVAAANHLGWDALAWNMRGCSEEDNLRIQSYHSGCSDDLQLVFSHALFKKGYNEITLVGFSLGGNVTLKFLGEQGESIRSLITAAVCFSVPCDLAQSARQLHKRRNRRYLKHFRKSLRQKIARKRVQFPHYLPDRKIQSLKNFDDIDSYYTAPVHGYRTAEEYWFQCSSKRFLRSIEIPTLLVNALDDPFLSPECFPVDIAKDHPYLTLEIPKKGGHVGFVEFNSDRRYWSERRAFEFFDEVRTAAKDDSQTAKHVA